MSESSKPIPLALPNGLLHELGDVADQMEMSRAELMRLCIRIGLVDLKAAHHDLPGVVKQLADDEGVSFTAFAAAHKCADSAPSPAPSPTSSPTPSSSANIVRLPPPPVVATLLHDIAAETTSAPVVQTPARPVRLQMKRRKKN